jgi:hypothetical protein
MAEVKFIGNNTHALLNKAIICTFVSSLPDGNFNYVLLKYEN